MLDGLVKKGFAPVGCTKIHVLMPKLSNFRNDMCNHLNMKKRFPERSTLVEIWVRRYLLQQRGCILYHSREVNEFYARLNQTLPYHWAFTSIESVMHVSVQKRVSNVSVVEFGVLSLWIYRTRWVHRLSIHICTLVLT